MIENIKQESDIEGEYTKVLFTNPIARGAWDVSKANGFSELNMLKLMVCCLHQTNGNLQDVLGMKSKTESTLPPHPVDLNQRRRL